MSSEASRRPAAPANRSSVSLLPRPPCTIHPSAIISDKAIISGTYPVTIGENTVVHPYAKLSTANAPVVIGAHCIIAERASVGLGSRSGEGLDFVVTVEDGVSIETGASVAGKRVGESSVVEVNGEVGAGAVVGKFCKISACCNVPAGESLPDFTVVFGFGQRRVDTTMKTREDVRELKQKGQLMHIDALKRLVPSNTAKWLS
ncbi:hypothetical protein H2203_008922 [Taxawa tesnikishii (nom. ined.)]|nr:hypothetical protein H2203_008922 [Dothideales sp. JES 119]